MSYCDIFPNILFSLSAVFPVGPAATDPGGGAVPLQLRGRGGGGGPGAQPDRVLLPAAHVGGGAGGRAGRADQLPAGAAGLHGVQRVRVVPASQLHQVRETALHMAN